MDPGPGRASSDDISESLAATPRRLPRPPLPPPCVIGNTSPATSGSVRHPTKTATAPPQLLLPLLLVLFISKLTVRVNGSVTTDQRRRVTARAIVK